MTNMENKSEKAEPYFSEIIEELPVAQDQNTGGELSSVENEDKPKVFFFGRPGCLLNSPLTTGSTQDVIPKNENNPIEIQNKIEDFSKEELADQEDEADLLRKISEALNDGDVSKKTNDTEYGKEDLKKNPCSATERNEKIGPESVLSCKEINNTQNDHQNQKEISKKCEPVSNNIEIIEIQEAQSVGTKDVDFLKTKTFYNSKSSEIGLNDKDHAADNKIIADEKLEVHENELQSKLTSRILPELTESANRENELAQLSSLDYNQSKQLELNSESSSGEHDEKSSNLDLQEKTKNAIKDNSESMQNNLGQGSDSNLVFKDITADNSLKKFTTKENSTEKIQSNEELENSVSKIQHECSAANVESDKLEASSSTKEHSNDTESETKLLAHQENITSLTSAEIPEGSIENKSYQKEKNNLSRSQEAEKNKQTDIYSQKEKSFEKDSSNKEEENKIEICDEKTKAEVTHIDTFANKDAHISEDCDSQKNEPVANARKYQTESEINEECSKHISKTIIGPEELDSHLDKDANIYQNSANTDFTQKIIETPSDVTEINDKTASIESDEKFVAVATTDNFVERVIEEPNIESMPSKSISDSIFIEDIELTESKSIAEPIFSGISEKPFTCDVVAKPSRDEKTEAGEIAEVLNPSIDTDITEDKSIAGPIACDIAGEATDSSNIAEPDSEISVDETNERLITREEVTDISNVVEPDLELNVDETSERPITCDIAEETTGSSTITELTEPDLELNVDATSERPITCDITEEATDSSTIAEPDSELNVGATSERPVACDIAEEVTDSSNIAQPDLELNVDATSERPITYDIAEETTGSSTIAEPDSELNVGATSVRPITCDITEEATGSSNIAEPCLELNVDETSERPITCDMTEVFDSNEKSLAYEVDEETKDEHVAPIANENNSELNLSLVSETRIVPDIPKGRSDAENQEDIGAFQIDYKLSDDDTSDRPNTCDTAAELTKRESVEESAASEIILESVNSEIVPETVANVFAEELDDGENPASPIARENNLQPAENEIVAATFAGVIGEESTESEIYETPINGHIDEEPTKEEKEASVESELTLQLGTSEIIEETADSEIDEEPNESVDIDIFEESSCEENTEMYIDETSVAAEIFEKETVDANETSAKSITSDILERTTKKEIRSQATVIETIQETAAGNIVDEPSGRENIEVRIDTENTSEPISSNFVVEPADDDNLHAELAEPIITISKSVDCNINNISCKTSSEPIVTPKIQEQNACASSEEPTDRKCTNDQKSAFKEEEIFPIYLGKPGNNEETISVPLNLEKTSKELYKTQTELHEDHHETASASTDISFDNSSPKFARKYEILQTPSESCNQNETGRIVNTQDEPFHYSKELECHQEKCSKEIEAEKCLTSKTILGSTSVESQVNRKRKMTEKKREPESESDILSSDAKGKSDDQEEFVLHKKKPRMRAKHKLSSPRKKDQTGKAASLLKELEPNPEIKNESIETMKEDVASKTSIQDLKFDFDANEDTFASIAAVKSLMSKVDNKNQSESEKSGSENDDTKGKRLVKRTRRSKRGRYNRKIIAKSSDEEDAKRGKVSESKRSKPAESDPTVTKKKREIGLLKDIDTSLVLDMNETETPVRQSRRIAQQKIREETERRQMEEKMLKKMKDEAERKKKGGSIDLPDISEPKDSSADDESFKGARRKKKTKIKSSDKPWQTSSSFSEQSERSEAEDFLEHIQSDVGSPLFKSDHEFSPESDVENDDSTQVLPLQRARTAKKVVAESTTEEEDINPKHACQVCSKTDSPEWILLCDECDCGYHCSCLTPIIFLIPSGNWYCPLCCHKKLIDRLTEQLTELDTVIHNIKAEETRKQRQILNDISAENILAESLERRNKRNRDILSEERFSKSKNIGSGSESSDTENSSDNAPLNEYFYKLRKRNQTAAPSYRFNEYDDLINSAIHIHDEMEEVKGAGNAGKGKDISTIIEADREEKKNLTNNTENEENAAKVPDKQDDSSGSELIRSKKSIKRRKKNRRLNNLDFSSEEERGSDEDFKGTSSSDSDEEENYSMSSVSESSLDLPLKKGKSSKNIRSVRTRRKRFEEKFIDDNSDSDDEPLVKAKRSKKKADSDEEEFDLNDDEDDEGSIEEDIDSEDLCDDTETSESSDNNWPKRKKRRIASYDKKTSKKIVKKNDDEDKAFRAGISKQKILKKSDNESDNVSGSDVGKVQRKTRGKKLLYLIEDDLESSDDGIKPGVRRPETPPEERELFIKKQEEIKRMLAAKNTEAAKQLAVPTVEPIKDLLIEKPISPLPVIQSEPSSSLSTIPKQVIESAKALDTDYNRIKPIPNQMSVHSKITEGYNSNEMNEEQLAKMMEEEDFAQHQLKLAGEAIARSKKLLELESKAKDSFAAYTKPVKDRPLASELPIAKKRSKKIKLQEKPVEEVRLQQNLTQPSLITKPSTIPTNLTTQVSPSIPPALTPSNIPAHLAHQMIDISKMNYPFDRPSVLSMASMPRHPHNIPQPPPPLKYTDPKIPLEFQQKVPMPQNLIMQSTEENEEKKKGRRKKFTPLRTDLPHSNSALGNKIDPPVASQPSTTNPRLEDKSKASAAAPRIDATKLSVANPPQIFNPAANPSPSVITRLLQPQQRYPQGFVEHMNARPPPSTESIASQIYPPHSESKPSAPSTTSGRMPPQSPSRSILGTNPQFGENPFDPRSVHPLYRPTQPPQTIYGLPTHARIPYPFPHLHPGSQNIRAASIQDYASTYGIPPQFSYYAPTAHSRLTTPQAAVPVPLVPETRQQNSIQANSEQSDDSLANTTSEFGGLVSYFSSQQELD